MSVLKAEKVLKREFEKNARENPDAIPTQDTFTVEPLEDGKVALGEDFGDYYDQHCEYMDKVVDPAVDAFLDVLMEGECHVCGRELDQNDDCPVHGPKDTWNL